MMPPRSTGGRVRSGAIRQKNDMTVASVRWLKSDSQSPHINQRRRIIPLMPPIGSLKRWRGVWPLRTPCYPFLPLTRYNPSRTFASDAVGYCATGTGEVAAQIGDRVVRAKTVDQVLQRDRLAVATFVTANVDAVVVIFDVLQGCRGVLLVWFGHGMFYQ